MISPHASSPARGRRAVYAAVALFYVLLFAALIWPVYPIFATIEPRILEMPFSLAYVVGTLILSFAVLLGLYVWEGAAGGPAAEEGATPAAAEHQADRTAGPAADPMGADQTPETNGASS